MDRETFEEKKQRLLKEATRGFNQLNSNLQVLNRNLEIVNSIASQLVDPLKVWSEFQNDLSQKPTTEHERKDNSSAGFSATPSSLGEEHRIGR